MKKKLLKENSMQSIYKLQAELCSALASPVRLHILDLLAEGELTATDLLEVLGIPKANLSQHLAVLKDAGIIQSRKKGLFQYMSLSVPKIKDACILVRSVLVDKMALEEKKNSELIRELRLKK